MLHGKKLMNIGTLLMEYNSFYQRSEYDKGRFWPNLRNCLYRYNIKQNH